MRPGVRLGIDVGKSRVGVARSDAAGLMAVPVRTLPRETALSELAALVADCQPIEIVCGLPLSLAGRDTDSTADARLFAGELSALCGVPIRLVDERLSTVSAQNALRDASHTVKSSRPVIDQVAATILLEVALSAERAGNTLGEMLGES